MRSRKATKATLTFLSLLLVTLILQTSFAVYVATDNTIVKQTKESVLIVAGKISDIQYVQPDASIGHVFTDVTISVSEVLKGEPNINENTARFRIRGGRGIDPRTGQAMMSDISTNIEFPIGDELILFITKNSSENEGAYDSLYPIMHPHPPVIEDIKADGQTHRVARFALGFYEEKYTMNLPLDLAFRFIKTTVKAPDEVSLLEEKIRPLKSQDLQRGAMLDQPESPKFLSMIEDELTRIDEAIKEREKNNENAKEGNDGK